MDKFQKEVLKKLDKIIELLSEKQKDKSTLLEDTKQNSNAPIYPITVYRGNIFTDPREYEYFPISISNDKSIPI